MKGTDQYRLAISDNGKVVGGITLNGGSWTGQFIAMRRSRKRGSRVDHRSIPHRGASHAAGWEAAAILLIEFVMKSSSTTFRKAASPRLVQHCRRSPKRWRRRCTRNTETHRAGRPGAAVSDGLILQEVSTEREIEIPAKCGNCKRSGVLRLCFGRAGWRRRWIRGADLLQVRGREPSGSHKLNTAVAQAYYNKMEGTKHL